MIGIIYGAIVAAMQTDLKRVIAYSSVAHMGFVVLGIFSLTVIGIDGAVFTMVSHPLTTGALFLARRHALRASAHARDQRDYRRHLEVGAGPQRRCSSPRCSPASACPGSPASSASSCRCSARSSTTGPYAIVATFGVILAAVYMLWAFQRAFTGKPQGENAKIKDVTVRELVVVVPLLGAQPVPRPLPEAGARPHRAVGRSARSRTSSARPTTASPSRRSIVGDRVRASGSPRAPSAGRGARSDRR